MSIKLKLLLMTTAVIVAGLLGSMASQDVSFSTAAANCSWNSTIEATPC